MEGDGQHSVGVVEGLLDPIPVVDIDVQVQHPGMHFQELEDADDDIVDVAEPTGFRFLGMMVPTPPVDGDVGDASEDDVCGVHAPPGCQLAEMVEPLEAGTIEALVDLEEGFEFGIIANLPLLIVLVGADDFVPLAGDPLFEVLYVAGVVEKVQFLLAGLLALKHGEVVAEFIALNQGVGHLNALGLHRVLLAEVVVRYRVVVQVAHLPHCPLFNYYPTYRPHSINIDLYHTPTHAGRHSSVLPLLRRPPRCKDLPDPDRRLGLQPSRKEINHFIFHSLHPQGTG